MRTLFTALFALAFALPSSVGAGSNVVTETHTYVMGDNDSRADARVLCAAAAKRNALEKVGSILESNFSVQQAETDGRIRETTKKETSSYLAAVVGSEPAGERFDTQGDRQTITCTVRMSFDPDEVRKKLNAITNDRDTREKLEVQQNRIDELERRLQGLTSTAPSQSLPDLAQQKFDTRASLDQAEVNRRQIAASMRSAEQRAMLVQRGMTTDEVITVAGKPRFTKEFASRELWNFGRLWIVIGDHKYVQCVADNDYAFCGQNDATVR